MHRKMTIFALLGFVLIAARAGAGTAVSYPSGSETVSGYLSVPDGAGK